MWIGGFPHPLPGGWFFSWPLFVVAAAAVVLAVLVGVFLMGELM